MNNKDIFMSNDTNHSNNNNILFEVINKLENIVNDLNNNKKIDLIIKQIRNIIIIMNNTINENRKNNKDFINNNTVNKIKEFN